MPDATPLDTLADALAGRLLEALPAGRPHGREALTRLPAPVAHLLTAALERRIARESALPQSAWLDAEDGALVDAARRWRDAVRGAARYPAEAWAPALHDACRLALRHLVDPADAAGAFCFAGERGELPAATVRARLSAFGPYPYLREIVEEYVGRKGLTHLDRAALEGLVRRIDRRMAAGYGVAEWTALLEGLYALAGAVPGEEGRVPTPLLRRFFAVRGAEGIGESLPARPALTAAEVRAALTAALAPAPAPPAVRDLLVDPRDAAAATAAFTPPDTEPPFLGPRPPLAAPVPAPEPEPVAEREPGAEPPPPDEDTADAALLEPDEPGDDLAEATLDTLPDEDLDPEALEPEDREETEPEPLTDDAPWQAEADDVEEPEGYTLIDETDGPGDGDEEAPDDDEAYAPESGLPAPAETETDDEDGWETVEPEPYDPDADEGWEPIDGDEAGPAALADEPDTLDDEEGDAAASAAPEAEAAPEESGADEERERIDPSPYAEDDEEGWEPVEPDEDDAPGADALPEPEPDEETAAAEPEGAPLAALPDDAPEEPDTWAEPEDTDEAAPEAEEPDALGAREAEPEGTVLDVLAAGQPDAPPADEPLWQRLAREHAALAREPEPQPEAPEPEAEAPEPEAEAPETEIPEPEATELEAVDLAPPELEIPEPEAPGPRPPIPGPPPLTGTAASTADWFGENAARARPGEPPPPDAVPTEALWERFAREAGHAESATPGGANPHAPEPLGRLEARVLGPDALERRDWFIAHVAGGTEAAYRSLLDALDDAESWDDAWPVLAAAFKRNEVDIYSAPAVAFTDAVEARFL